MSKPSQPKRQPFRQPPRAKRRVVFAAAAELFYHPDLGVADLADRMGLAYSTTKRVLRALKQARVLFGRAGNLRVTPANLPNYDEAFSQALIQVAADASQFTAGERPDPSDLYSTEGELLDWLVAALPRQELFAGTIIVEDGDILMGAVDHGLVIRAHGVSPGALFDFARLGVEQAPGVRHTRTLMVAQSVRPSA